MCDLPLFACLHLLIHNIPKYTDMEITLSVSSNTKKGRVQGKSAIPVVVLVEQTKLFRAILMKGYFGEGIFIKE